MHTRATSGFTIIETTLFLAISGVLIVAMVIGAGAALNNQRYRDAGESFKSLVQAQYSEVRNVENARDGNWTCESDAKTKPGGSTGIGQSDCFLVGRYMEIRSTTITTYKVLARKTGTGTASSDINTIKANYTFNVSRDEVEEENMEWGTRIAWAKAGPRDVRSDTSVDRSIALLFLRSPESGQIYTFTSDTVPAKGAANKDTIKAMMQPTRSIPGQADRVVCVASAGLVRSDSGLYLSSYAASASAVELLTNDAARASKGGSSC